MSNKKLDVVDEKELNRKEPVVKGKEYKPGIPTRLNHLFFGSEGIQGVAKGLVFDVLVPSIKNSVVDTLTGGIERVVLGEDYVGRRRGSRGYRNVMPARGGRMDATYTAYDAEYGRGRRERNNRSTDLKQIMFDSRVEAQSLFNVMQDNLDEYGLVSVADFYELADVDAKFIDHSFGWTNLAGTRIVASSGGQYFLDLPQPKQI